MDRIGKETELKRTKQERTGWEKRHSLKKTVLKQAKPDGTGLELVDWKNQGWKMLN